MPSADLLPPSYGKAVSRPVRSRSQLPGSAQEHSSYPHGYGSQASKVRCRVSRFETQNPVPPPAIDSTAHLAHWVQLIDFRFIFANISVVPQGKTAGGSIAFG